MVFAVDGATWSLLDKFILDGTMPTLGGLRDSCLWGHVRSTIPPLTAPAWASFATGKNPGKTGVFDFVVPHNRLNEVEILASDAVKSETFAEILEGAGLKVGLINLVGLSYPPKIRGYVLGDMLSPPDKLVHPEALLANPLFRNYRAFVSDESLGKIANEIDEITRLEKVRFDCARYLFEHECDLVFVNFEGIDWIQHSIFSDLISLDDSSIVTMAKQAYRDIDGYLGWFLAHLEPQDYLLVVSDHGFKRYSGKLNINKWLRNRGYLSRRANPMGMSLRVRDTVIPLPEGLLRRIKLSDSFAYALGKLLGLLSGNSVSPDLKMNLDPARTSAFQATEGGWSLYLNTAKRFMDGTIGKGLEKPFATRLKRELEELVKRGFIEECLLSEEVYRGPYVDLAPELLLIPKSLWPVGYSGLELVSRVPYDNHDMDGIYVLKSPGVRRGRRDCAIYDFFPTILSVFGIEVGPDVDGKSIFSKSESTTDS